MDSQVNVVSIFSSSYTGTTWLNFVLASHPDAFYLGPYDRARHNLVDYGVKACRIHGENCPFWSGFFKDYDPEQNFFVQLARYSGKRYFLINNPNLNQGIYARDLTHPNVRLMPLLVVRDLRALFASKLRKSSQDSAIRILNDFVGWCANRPAEISKTFSNLPIIRYEDAQTNLAQVLQTAGQYLGLDYSPSAEQFWEHEHHPVAGNHGPCSFVAFHHGNDYPDFIGKEHYEKQFQEIQQKSRPAFTDERWRQELSPSLLHLFDQKFGEINAKLGYQRDSFQEHEKQLNQKMYEWRYDAWLDALQGAGANFVTARDVREGKISKDRCNIIIRHDTDDSDYRVHVWPMLQAEAKRGIRSTTYVFSQTPVTRKVHSFWSPSRPFDPEELKFFQD